MLPRWREETGSFTILAVVFAFALLFATTGLVYDGGRLLVARRDANDVAAAAARAGSQAPDGTSLRSHRRALPHTAAAVTAARHYLAAANASGTVQIVGDRVRVTVTRSYRPLLLGAVGLGDRSVTGTREARLIRGVTRGET